MHYNLAYIKARKGYPAGDGPIANTKGEGKAGDDFWVKAETLLYTALMGYIHHEARKASELYDLISSSMPQRSARMRGVPEPGGSDVRRSGRT